MNAGFNPADTPIKGTSQSQQARQIGNKGDFSAVMSGSLLALKEQQIVSKQTKPEKLVEGPEAVEKELHENKPEIIESPSIVASQVNTQVGLIEPKSKVSGDTLFKEGIERAEQGGSNEEAEAKNEEPGQKANQTKEAEKPVENKAKPAEKETVDSAKKSEEFLQKIIDKKPEQQTQGDLIRNAVMENSKKTFAAVASEKFASMRMEQRKVLEGLGATKAPVASSASVSEGISLGLQAAQNKGGTTYIQAKSDVRSPAFKSELFETLNASISRKLNTVTMKLAPEALGAMKIQMEMKGDEITMSVMAKDGQTAAMIASTIQELKDSFAEKGMNLVQVSISQEGAGQQNGNQQDEYAGQAIEGLDQDQEENSSTAPKASDDGVISKA